MIWICCTEKHEDVTRAALKTLESLVQYVDLTRLGQIFGHISQTKEEDFTELHVTFLKEYTINALKNLQNSQTKMVKETKQA